jgi:hypothetical protein
MDIQRDAGAGLDERMGQGTGVDLAAADDGLQIYVMYVNQRFVFFAA